MKKFLMLCLALVLCLAVMPAQAAPRYPEQSDVISDTASVLSRETVDALNSFNKTLREKTGARLNVATVHFLDGEDIKTYTDTLFGRWGLSEDDLLLVLAVGEDSFYTAAGAAIGKKLPQNSRELLFTQDFRSRMTALDYDGAMRVYVPELTRVLSKQYGVTIALPAHFGVSEPQSKPTATPKPVQSGQDVSGKSSVLSTRREAESKVQRVERGYGVSFGKLLLLVIIFYLVFSPRRRVRKWGRAAGCSSCGCGCAPLSWLLVLLGVREAIKK